MDLKKLFKWLCSNSKFPSAPLVCAAIRRFQILTLIIMVAINSFLLFSLTLNFLSYTGCSSDAGDSFETSDPHEIAIVGSTPGDNLIKSMLSISSPAKVDFIRWNLKLNDSTSNQNTFVLEILFGEGKQGTPDFIGGGERRRWEGNYSITKTGNWEIFSFKSKQLPSVFTMVKLN